MREKIEAVIQTLCGLFENKSELRGFDDWNKFVGCIMVLEQVAESIQEPEMKSEEVNDNGR